MLYFEIRLRRQISFIGNQYQKGLSGEVGEVWYGCFKPIASLPEKSLYSCAVKVSYE